jgi:outer membrane protein TolC
MSEEVKPTMEVPEALKQFMTKFADRLAQWMRSNNNTNFPIRQNKDGSYYWLNREQRRAAYKEAKRQWRRSLSIQLGRSVKKAIRANAKSDHLAAESDGSTGNETT